MSLDSIRLLHRHPRFMSLFHVINKEIIKMISLVTHGASMDRLPAVLVHVNLIILVCLKHDVTLLAIWLSMDSLNVPS